MNRALLVLAACHAASPKPPAFDPTPIFIAGRFDGDTAPDGNSIFLDAPDGLVLVDTGRHPAHQDKLLAKARALGKPIVAIINTHWHLDHSGGNAEIRAAFPAAQIVTTSAIDRAYTDFLLANRPKSDAFLASGKASPEQVADIMRDRAAVDDPAKQLWFTLPITRSQILKLAGRTLDLRVTSYAATEADLWIYDPASKTAIVGDLVVAPVPFFDTGCADGWLAALDAIAATPFETLIPGHGEPMTRAAFTTWKTAFAHFVACAATAEPATACAANWRRDASPPADPTIDEYAAYYIDNILRSADAKARFCKSAAP
jgi:glyoxylase-like metal-dependent hydrolase (beta-lactamase superfamily II)